MKEEDREVLSYVLFKIFALIQQILVFTAVAIILNAVAQTVVFLLFFGSIKRYAGGAHINKHWLCLTVSAALLVAVCLLSKMIVLPWHIALAAPMVALTLVLLRSPVIHPNNPKPERKRKVMRKTSICIAVFQCVLIAGGCLIWTAMVLPGAIGGLAASITLVLPVPENEK
jgi:accessory gene regulator B